MVARNPVLTANPVPIPGPSTTAPPLDPKEAALRLEELRHAKGLPVGPAAQIATGQKTLAQMAPSGVPDWLAQATGAGGAQKPQQSLQDVLSAILGGQTGTIPQGYADFFTSVLGPLMAQTAGSFKAPPFNPQDLAAMKPEDRSAVEKAYGQSAAGLQQMLAGETLGATMAPGLEQILGPISNYQKLVQQLVNALGFIPYSAQGIASMPVQAGSVLSQLGINPAGGALAAPGASPPFLNPGAVVTAGG